MIAVPLVTMPSHSIVWVNGFQVCVADAGKADPDRDTHGTTNLGLANGMQLTVRGNIDTVLRCLAGDEEVAKTYYEVYVEPTMVNGPKTLEEIHKPKLIL